MSLTVHLASMPRRSEANAAAKPISEKSLTVEPHGAPAVIRPASGSRGLSCSGRHEAPK